MLFYAPEIDRGREYQLILPAINDRSEVAASLTVIEQGPKIKVDIYFRYLKGIASTGMHDHPLCQLFPNF